MALPPIADHAAIEAKTSAAGMTRMASICRKLAIAVGFSNGCAPFTLKKPPPLVPSILMAAWLATAPSASV